MSPANIGLVLIAIGIGLIFGGPGLLALGIVLFGADLLWGDDR